MYEGNIVNPAFKLLKWMFSTFLEIICYNEDGGTIYENGVFLQFIEDHHY